MVGIIFLPQGVVAISDFGYLKHKFITKKNEKEIALQIYRMKNIGSSLFLW